MSGTKIFVDTNIIIQALNGDVTLSHFLNNRRVYISFVTELELLGFNGLDEEDKKVMQSFIDDCTIININKSIKEEVIRLRKFYKVKLPDIIIMASSIYMDLPIITSDKGFKRVEEELSLIFYEI